SFGAETRLAQVDADQIQPLIAPQPRPTPLFGRPSTRTATRNPEMRSVLAAVDSLSYAVPGEAAADPTSAASAVDTMAAGGADAAMAAASGAAPDPSINLQLGVFSDPAAARSTAMQFALLGAVDEDAVTDGDGQPATRLTLSRLKPGVERQDVVDLIHKLGLG